MDSMQEAVGKAFLIIPPAVLIIRDVIALCLLVIRAGHVSNHQITFLSCFSICRQDSPTLFFVKNKETRSLAKVTALLQLVLCSVLVFVHV